MKVKTNIRAGFVSLNHNETLVRAGDKAKRWQVNTQPNGLKVKTNVKAGIMSGNHNETLVRAANMFPKCKVPGRRVSPQVGL
jgi:hypothetical protein